MRLRLLLILSVCLPTVALADVRLPHIISDHMVLQAGQTIPVWGWADPGERVTVHFEKQTKRVRTDATGHWRVDLAPLTVAPGDDQVPKQMTVKGAKNTLNVNDILIGEVWLASGQSNMEKPLGEQRGQKPTLNADAEIAAATWPGLRLFKVAHARADTPAEDVAGSWVVCDPSTIDKIKFSAVGYFFGRKLLTTLKTPVGMIDSTWGGTRIELWTPRSGFAAVPTLKNFADAPVGAKVEGTALSTLYNGQIKPLVPFAIKGVIWYQGESNTIDVNDGDRYLDKMTALITGWRKEWQRDFPIYYVQVAPFLYHLKYPGTIVSSESGARLWEAQTAALKLPQTGIVVTTDLADDLLDIHPRNKKAVGERLANWALAKDYAQTGITVSGPIFRTMAVAAGVANLSFDYADGLVARDGKPLNWFTIAGADDQFYPAKAIIEGDHILVNSPQVPEPVAVRFGWDEAAQPNLINGAGLPAVPFRTDNPLIAKASQ